MFVITLANLDRFREQFFGCYILRRTSYNVKQSLTTSAYAVAPTLPGKSLSFRDRKLDADLRISTVRSTHPSVIWAFCYRSS